MADFVAYYRVSPGGRDRPGVVRLGLDAQREAVARHLAAGGTLLAEFIEEESGKRHTNRPELAAALAECRKRKATLVIAKLDRLSRNVAFIANLMESGVAFIACDNPHANRLMLHMLAAFAEHEREQISQRTRAALKAAKARGTRLGNPRIETAWKAHREAAEARRPPATVLAQVAGWRRNGASLREIGRRLDGLGVRPPRGGRWCLDSLSRLARSL